MISELVNGGHFQVIDLAARDALLIQRKLEKRDCEKNECRFAIAKSIGVADQMLESSVEQFDSNCLVVIKRQDVKKGTLIKTKTRENVACNLRILTSALKELASEIGADKWTATESKEPNVNVSTEGMVQIPAGTFWRGCSPKDTSCDEDEKPGRKIFLNEFWIDKTEVTVNQYRKCVEQRSCSTDKTNGEVAPLVPFEESLSCNYPNRPNHPMNCVNWFQAKSFCDWVGKDLPTEAQWQKAARGKDTRIYPWGNQPVTCDFAVVDRLVNYQYESGCGRNSTWPVGSKPTDISPFGALDMAGNIGEWIRDSYDKDYYTQSKQPDPINTVGADGILLGGSFLSGSRISSRIAIGQEFHLTGAGFRCAR